MQSAWNSTNKFLFDFEGPHTYIQLNRTKIELFSAYLELYSTYTSLVRCSALHQLNQVTWYSNDAISKRSTQTSHSSQAKIKFCVKIKAKFNNIECLIVRLLIELGTKSSIGYICQKNLAHSASVAFWHWFSFAIPGHWNWIKLSMCEFGYKFSKDASLVFEWN